MPIALDERAEDAKPAPTRKSAGTKRAARARRQVDRERFRKVHRAEKHFGRQLKAVAKEVGKIVSLLAPGGVVRNAAAITAALERYAERLGPWAKAVAERTVAEVATFDRQAWVGLGAEIGRALEKEIAAAPTGAVMRENVDQRVVLIKSLPREAGRRVHHFIVEGMSRGVRAAETAREIRRTRPVTESRAMLIARTETTSCATALVEARARYIGSEGYFWETSEDADVRDDHKSLQGKFIRWDAPPIAGTGKGGIPQRYHAGAGPNCRCWPRPEIPHLIA